MNNHLKDAHKVDAIAASHHFAMKEHIFDRDASYMIIEKIRRRTLNRETKKNLLKQRQNFRIGKLEKSFS